MQRKTHHAGYCLEGVYHFLIENGYTGQKLNNLLQSLTAFDCFTNFNTDNDGSFNAHPFVAIMDNLISRGFPTMPSYHIAKNLSNQLPYLEVEEKDKEVELRLNHTSEEFPEKLFRALHVIDPDESQDQLTEKLESQTDESPYEKDFVQYLIQNNAALTHLLEPQKDLESILTNKADANTELKRYTDGSIDTYLEEKLDFAVKMPYKLKDGTEGRAIEIDGPQHKEEPQKTADQNRNNALRLASWGETFRFEVENGNWPNWKTQFKRLSDELLQDPQTGVFQKNLDQPLKEDKQGKSALNLALVPFGIARIQKLLLKAIDQDVLKLSESNWQITIIERDLPCGYWAISDLLTIQQHLSTLASHEAFSFPSITLTIYYDEDYQIAIPESEKQDKIQVSYKTLDQLKDNHWDDDLVIDSSLLRRGPIKPSDQGKLADNQPYAILRSTNFFGKPAGILCERRVQYDSLLSEYTNQEGESSKQLKPAHHEALRFFLKSLFRKNDFWRGQLDILDRSLQNQNLVGLLPTGAGKSLTFQLSCLLQPGISLIMAPLKPLMENQVDSLKDAWIHRKIAINSDRSTLSRSLLQERLAEGQYQFCYVAPERLLIEEFQQKLTELIEKDKKFNYGVIDEVHCVSEWGHDFRPSYLKIGENLRTCLAKNEESSVPLIGLTATASFDVLTDVQRELRIEDEAVITAKYLERSELHFETVKVDVDEEQYQKTNNFFQRVKVIDEAKRNSLIGLLENLPNQFNNISNGDSLNVPDRIDQPGENDQYTFPGIVFSPFKSSAIPSGVQALQKNLTNHFSEEAITYYYGGGNGLGEHQKNFIKGNKALMVATKAFGMGVDKKDIRYTIHMNHPNSIESLVQETGRAGRDGKEALAYILLADKPEEKGIHQNFLKNSFKGNKKETHVIGDILNEITFPQEVNKDSLQQEMMDYAGKKVVLKFGNNNNWLFVNHEYKNNFGRINLNSLQGSIERQNTQLPERERNEVINHLKDIIQQKCPANENAFDWLNTPANPSNKAGILPELQNLPDGESKDLFIGFRNDQFRQIAEIAGEDFTEAMVLKATEYMNEEEDIVEKLKNEYYKLYRRDIDIPENKHPELRNRYYKTRDQEETLKAVYRLACIGLVKDFLVDYKAQLVKAKIVKKTGKKYLEALRDYLGNYYSNERVQSETEDLEAFTGQHYEIIKMGLRVLVNFTYREIKAKRESAIDIVADTCRNAYVNNNENFSSEIWRIFESRYFEPLARETNNAQEFDERLIWYYILEECQGMVDRVKHLNGACLRLIPENPQNGAILILAGYSLFFNPVENKAILNRAQEYVDQGLLAFRNQKQYSDSDCLRLYNNLKDQLEKESGAIPDELAEIEDFLVLKLKTDHLELFNEKLFANYE